MSADEERTDAVRNRGREGGLFRSCMDEIRGSHSVGQALRHTALAAGLLTDAGCYAELLGQFYVATAALEGRMEELTMLSSKKDESSSPLVDRVRGLGYSFKLGYERDLLALLGPDWKATIKSWTTKPAQQYVRRLQSATDVECAAAAFILHGPLIIGGGAALKPRVERAFGEGATNVFEGVVGTARGGRSRRQREFIALYDTLLDQDGSLGNSEQSSDDPRFAGIVEACGEFMRLNNEIMLAVRRHPWWRKYVVAGAVAAMSALMWRALAQNTPSPRAAVSSISTS